jgi:hypothetical protein
MATVPAVVHLAVGEMTWIDPVVGVNAEKSAAGFLYTNRSAVGVDFEITDARVSLRREIEVRVVAGCSI